MSIYYLDRPDFAPIVLNYPGRPIYAGESMALEAYASWMPIPPSSIQGIIGLMGTGRVLTGVMGFKGPISQSMMTEVKALIYTDGVKRAEWSLWDFEAYLGYTFFWKAFNAGTEGWYAPDVLHPRLSPIGAHYDPTLPGFDEYYVMFNFVIEFTESFEFKVWNETGYEIHAFIRLIAGYYP